MNIFTGKRILFILFAVLALLGGTAIYLEQFLRLDTYKDQILSELNATLNRKVTYSHGEFSLRYGPSFTFSGVSVSERDNHSDFLRAKRLTLKIALLPLLNRKIIINHLSLDSPHVTLSRNHDGTFSISDLMQQKPSSLTLQIRGIKIRNGIIDFSDHRVTPQGVRMILSGTDLVLSHISRGKKGNISLSGKLSDGTRSFGSIAVKGSMRIAPSDTPLDRSNLDISISTKALAAAPFWPYYSAVVPFKKIEGNLSTVSSFKGEIRRFTAKGSLKITNARFDYQPVFHSVLEPRSVSASYILELTPDAVDVKSIDATVDGVRIKGSCAIRDLTTRDPRIIAKASSTPIRLEDFSRYIPYGTIVREPSEFIEQKIKGGIIRVVDGTLDGRVSQILTMEKGTNYNVLSVRGTVEKGIIDWGGGVPLFTHIRGDLELAGKDFTLRRMTGRFGSSPFSLEGALKDYPLITPTIYPFTMTMSPSSSEVSWLCRLWKYGPVGFSGNSTLHLTGDGPTKKYALSGLWNLGSASYSLPGILNKPAGMNNSASFQIGFTPEETAIKEIVYQLPPLLMKAEALRNASNDEGFTFSLSTNLFSINDLAPLAPKLGRYNPQGNFQIALHGLLTSGTESPARLSGKVSFTGASASLIPKLQPFRDLNGTVTFKDSGLETSLISAKLGSTALYCKGTLRNFENPVFSLSFSSPLVIPEDLGLTGGSELHPQKVQGVIQYQDQITRITSLAMQLNSTRLALKGTVKDLRNPHAELEITSPHLELADLLPLSRLGSDKSGAATTGSLSLKASLKADSVSFKDFRFEKLAGDIIYADGILYLQPLEFQAWGGTIASKVRVDSGGGKQTRYQANFEMRRISSQGLLKALGAQKQEVWGSLSAQGELNARGGSSDMIKKSLLGSVSFRIENGSIRRFASLSKIFSILNVSQLLKMQAPEMVSGGMPFSEITGTVAIKDGIFTTSDLFVKSESMNLSAVGSMNLPLNSLNVIVGVQPLQAIDTVVNRIPVVGWILTGKDDSWIISYFEITGQIGNPQVSVKTVSTMATGVLNVFKRVFQLPAKIFTDTGAVMLGE